MAHYVCRGENCKSTSDRPTICLEPSCLNRYKLLDECNCRDKKSHHGTMAHHHGRSHINIISMGISVGFVVAAYFLFLGLAATYLGWGNALVTSFSNLYIGYEATLIGSIAGGLWGFVDGFVFGVIIAWIYNALHRRNPARV